MLEYYKRVVISSNMNQSQPAQMYQSSSSLLQDIIVQPDNKTFDAPKIQIWIRSPIIIDANYLLLAIILIKVRLSERIEG